MSEEEAYDVFNYFRFLRYRDEGDILLDEYEELEAIIKRSKIVKQMENARYQMILKKITEEDYQELLMKLFLKANEIVNNSSFEHKTK